MTTITNAAVSNIAQLTLLHLAYAGTAASILLWIGAGTVRRLAERAKRHHDRTGRSNQQVTTLFADGGTLVILATLTTLTAAGSFGLHVWSAVPHERILATATDPNILLGGGLVTMTVLLAIGAAVTAEALIRRATMKPPL